MYRFFILRLCKSIASDLSGWGLHVVQYFYWNAKGVRLTPDCYADTKARIAPGCSFFDHARIYQRATIGALTYGTNCRIDNAIIGKFCSIGPGCIIGPNNHPLEAVSTHPHTYQADKYNAAIRPAVLGDDVWLGANCVVLAGVKVADGCVVAASAVVTEDVEPYSIVGGVPARLIGKRTAQPRFINLLKNTDSLSELRTLAEAIRTGHFTEATED